MQPLSDSLKLFYLDLSGHIETKPYRLQHSGQSLDHRCLEFLIILFYTLFPHKLIAVSNGLDLGSINEHRRLFKGYFAQLHEYPYQLLLYLLLTRLLKIP